MTVAIVSVNGRLTSAELEPYDDTCGSQNLKMVFETNPLMMVVKVVLSGNRSDSLHQLFANIRLAAVLAHSPLTNLGDTVLGTPWGLRTYKVAVRLPRQYFGYDLGLVFTCVLCPRAATILPNNALTTHLIFDDGFDYHKAKELEADDAGS